MPPSSVTKQQQQQQQQPQQQQQQQQQQILYTTTPWRHPSELLRIRNLLYSPTTQAEQAHAISTIAAWKLRGNVPHAVESSGLLFSAMLFHAECCESVSARSTAPCSDPTMLSKEAIMTTILPATTSFALRAAYTTALSRFVTGFADLGRHRSGRPGSSMFDVARSISLPPHFVELRHEGAHEEMPALPRLVSCAREAVGWLWGVYWGRLGGEDTGISGLRDAGEDVGGGEMGEEERLVLGERVRVVLKDFRAQRIAALKAGKGRKGEKKRAVGQVYDQCRSLCSGVAERDVWGEVARVLVDEGLIVPSLKQRGVVRDSALQGAYMLWDELLLQLGKRSCGFAEAFLERAIAYIARFTTTDVDHDSGNPTKWAIYRWIMHLLFSDDWLEARESGNDWRGTALRECALHPQSQWSKDLANDIVEQSDDEVRTICQGIVYASFLDDDEEADKDGTNSAQGADSDGEREVEMEEATQISSHGGWRRPAGPWKPLPIGVVQG